MSQGNFVRELTRQSPQYLFSRYAKGEGLEASLARRLSGKIKRGLRQLVHDGDAFVDVQCVRFQERQHFDKLTKGVTADLDVSLGHSIARLWLLIST